VSGAGVRDDTDSRAGGKGEACCAGGKGEVALWGAGSGTAGRVGVAIGGGASDGARMLGRTGGVIPGGGDWAGRIATRSAVSWIGVSRPVSSTPRMPPVIDGGRTTGAGVEYPSEGVGADTSRIERRDGGGAAGAWAGGGA